MLYEGAAAVKDAPTVAILQPDNFAEVGADASSHHVAHALQRSLQ